MKNRFEIHNDVVVIFLDKNNGNVLETIISIESLEKAMEYPNKWTHNSGYVVGKTVINKERKNYNFHRWLMGEPVGKEIDHINKNKLDNRLENLRIVTHHQNSQNRSVQTNNTSGVRGVFWSELHKKWRTQIRVQGKKLDFGLFDDIKDAEREIKKARKELLPYAVE